MGTSEAAPETPNILVVDDTPENLTLLVGMLKEQGYRVRPVPSGELALQAAAAEPPDLILLDISMPGMDGFEVCERLKADPRLKDIPVLFLTARTDIEDKVRSFEVGGVDYVTKPFQFAEVNARVRTHLELRRQKRELERNYEKLTELQALRDSLVHMLVHDLRSPLSALVGFLGFLKEAETKFDPDQREDIEESLKAAKRIILMVNGVLDVNKLEAGKMTIHPALCDVLALGREVVASLESLTEGRTLAFLPEGELSGWLDRGLLFRVLQNLIANALKFAPKTGGRVELHIESTGEETRFEVVDNGPGVPPEYQDRIFEKFGQVEGGGRSRMFSTGLGLTFCKMAVEAHGGRIGVVSKGGKGSTFWFTLPRKALEG
jgi:signal transduction histidine kinase